MTSTKFSNSSTHTPSMRTSYIHGLKDFGPTPPLPLIADVLYELSLSTHGFDDHAAYLDGVGAGAVGMRAHLDEAVVQREAPSDVRREDVGAVPQESDLQVEALQGCDSKDIYLSQNLSEVMFAVLEHV